MLQNGHEEMENKQKQTTIRQNDPQEILNNCKEIKNKGDIKRLWKYSDVKWLHI